MSVMEKFTQAIPLLNPWINSWKNEGKKVLGYFCSYIPDEIIYAADILPVRVRAMGATDTPMGDAYLTDTSCSFTRCCLELANRKQYEFLDGIISCKSCDQIRRLYDNLRYKAPFFFHHFLSTPGVINQITIDWFKHELFKFKEVIEKNFEVNITDEKLRNAIKTYNKTRSLLKEFYMLRKRESPPITGTDMMKVLTAAVSIPREEFNELLIQELKEASEREGISNHKARIILVGSMLDDPEYIKIIEDLGGLVVTDSLCLGTRIFWDLVDESSDPLGALAERYLSRVSCPRMAGDQPARIEFVTDLIKEFNIDGVILQRMKFCPLWWGDIFMLRRKLKELSIPFLDLEREYVLSGAGAMKTRVQTFLEILEAR
jgi:benzoyl-CoA reductase/2-hydroxyglutaryl-CoA dehydratase subunit BcrC/BadD/HgdB